MICFKAPFSTHVCEEERAIIKDLEYGHGNYIAFQQTSGSYSAYSKTSLEGLLEGSTLANHLQC